MNPVYAAVDIGTDLSLGTGRSISSTYPNIGTLVTAILKNSLTIAGVILLVLLIFGGVSFIIGASSNDSKKAAQGKAALTDALIGFVIVIVAYFIIQIVEVVTGVKILNSGL